MLPAENDLLCLLLTLYTGDTLFTYIPVHFSLSLLMIGFSLLWRKSYFKHQLYESGSAVLYTWTMRVLVVTFVLYALPHLIFVVFYRWNPVCRIIELIIMPAVLPGPLYPGS